MPVTSQDIYPLAQRLQAQLPRQVWTGAVAAICGRFPDLPLVGYETDKDLPAAHRAGFDSVGPLRVWLKN